MSPASAADDAETAATVHERAIAAESEFRRHVDDLNAVQDTYFSDLLPSSMGEAQSLETSNLMFLHQNLSAACAALELGAAPSALAAFRTAVDAVDVHNDINDFVRAHRTGRPTPPRHVFEQFVPVTPQGPTCKVLTNVLITI